MKTNKPNKQIKVSPEFALALDDIQIKRVKLGKDRDKAGDRLLSKKILKHPLWEKLKGDLETFDLTDE